jgi:hypothetical protein
MKCALRELSPLVVGVLVGLLPVPSAAESEPGLAGCVRVVTVGLLEAQPAPSPTPEDLRRPMTEQEVELLVRAMEPVGVDGGRGRAIRAAVEGTPLGRERLAVLLADATALLADLHARETLDRLKVTRGLAAGARARAERNLTAVRECVRAGFGGRGGDRPLAESVRLVEKHRAVLERVLLPGLEARRQKADSGSRPPGGGVPLGPASQAQNATLEVTQQTLNGLLGRLGSLADAGVHQPTASPALGTGQNCQPLGSLDCPAGSASNADIPLLVCSQPGGGLAIVPGSQVLPWQWRVTDAHFTLAEGSMSFTAVVHTRVGGQTNTDSRTVPASVSFDAVSNRLRVNIDAFTVPLQFEGVTITQADVAELYGISLPVEPQELSMPLPDGGTRTVIARGTGITPQYLPGKLQVGVDVAFTPPAAPTPVVHLAQVGARAPRLDQARLIPTGRSILRIYESTFNELAERIEPLRWSGNHKFKVCTLTNPITKKCVYRQTIYDCDYQARVTNLRFDITPSRILITGDVNAEWCGVSFDNKLETTASVTYSGASDAVRVTVNPTSIQPVLKLGGYEVPLPIHMNVAPSLTLPPFPISTGLFHFATAGGPIALRLSPSHVSVSRRDGYLELQAHVTLW